VYTLSRVFTYSRILGHGHALDSSVLMFWDFYLPLLYMSVVSRGCSRGEESCSLYLVDPVAIIEVRGEEVLASTLDGDRMWRQVPGVPDVFDLC
jgi:hypothetical protein